jgi:single-stranded-DNA-specific exonuclease
LTDQRWLEPAAVEVSDALRAVVGGHPLIAQILMRRGILTVEAAQAFLDPASYQPASPYDLPQMDRAVERIKAALAAQEPMAVWGDFDVDGQTSTALLVDALRGLGADARYYIPGRQEGHGVRMEPLKRLIDDGARLLITCDCGVSDVAEVEYARSRGVDTIITDHHQLPPVAPDAYATLDPQLLPPDHPMRGLPGVGCAYLLALALYDSAGRGGEVARLLDLVALGIVADVAPQTADTRYLLQRGLAALRTTQRPGLRALFALLNLDPSRIGEDQIAFLIAPRLNALGRLDDAKRSVEFLTAAGPDAAAELAQFIEGLNAQRRQLSNQVYTSARAQVEADEALLDGTVLVLADPEWHPGVLGLVANRLVEHYSRPAILLTTPPGERAFGSARSVPGFDITAALAAQSDLLATYGGHAGAAGLSLEPDRVDELRQRLAQSDAGDARGVDAGALAIDGIVSLSELSLDLIADLDRLAPFGAGNPTPVLAVCDVKARSFGPAGREGEHTQVIVEDATGKIQRVIWWHGGGQNPPEGRFDLAFALRVNEYRGERMVQVEWLAARATST